jgi:hypothetical protein
LPRDPADLLTGWLGSVDIRSEMLNWLIGWLGIVSLTSTTYTLDFGFMLGNVINVVVFIAKGWFLVFVMMWVRWTLPRLRIDQVMMTCLKYLLPISCVLLMGVSVWQLVMPAVVERYFKLPMCAVCLAVLVYVIFKLITLASTPPRAAMPGARRLADLPGYAGPGQGAQKTGAMS